MTARTVPMTFNFEPVDMTDAALYKCALCRSLILADDADPHARWHSITGIADTDLLDEYREKASGGAA